MFVTNDPHLYELVLTLSNHGRARGQVKQFWPDIVGYKYKMSNIQAAIGCAQMQRIEELTRVKREIFAMYSGFLKDLPVRMNPEPMGCTNGCWMPTFVVDDGIPFNRDDLICELKAKGVDARVFFWPLSSTSINGIKIANEPHYSDEICSRAMNLPSSFGMTGDDIQKICEIVSLTLNTKSCQ